MSAKPPACSRCFGTGYIPSDTCTDCVDCQDRCPLCAANERAEQAEAQLREAETRLRGPIDATRQGRLMLNGYGRACYDAGRAARAATDEALARLEQQMRESVSLQGQPSNANKMKWADTLRALRAGEGQRP